MFVSNAIVPIRQMEELRGPIARGSFFHRNQQHGKVPIYHTHALEDNNADLPAKLRSFMRLGVSEDLSRRREFLSNEKAIYYSNSLEYAVAWPTVQRSFALWAQYKSIPRVPMLIICQSVEVDILLGGGGNYSSWRIPQRNLEAAKTALASNAQSLTHSAERNLHSTTSAVERVAPPGSKFANYDTIISPVPTKEQDHLNQSVEERKCVEQIWRILW